MNQIRHQITLKRKLWGARLEYKFLRLERWVQERESDVAFCFAMLLLFLLQFILSLA